MKEISSAAARAYCSSANLGAGFDVFGLALDKFSDTVRVRVNQGRGVRISAKGFHAHTLPTMANRNSAGPPAVALLKKAGSKRGLQITVIKRVPQGLGLGSSGATAAACAKAVDHLLGLNLSDDEMVRVASLGEKAVAGTAHADNVAASLLGGFVIVYDNPVRTIAVKPPKNLAVVLVTPKVESQMNKTRQARRLVPRRIETRNALLNVGRASAIAAGFAQGDVRMIGTGMEDAIAEPYRQDLIPAYGDVKRIGLDAGADGVAISGAGPSMIALVDQARHRPQRIARAMAGEFARHNVESSWFVARPASGAKIVGGRQ